MPAERSGFLLELAPEGNTGGGNKDIVRIEHLKEFRIYARDEVVTILIGRGKHLVDLINALHRLGEDDDMSIRSVILVPIADPIGLRAIDKFEVILLSGLVAAQVVALPAMFNRREDFLPQLDRPFGIILVRHRRVFEGSIQIGK